uniref:Phage protein n=1 Tax=Klebsiella phage PMBT64 TaxID=3229740 RepID=A0AB39C324_9CAUD
MTKKQVVFRQNSAKTCKLSSAYTGVNIVV